MRNKYLDIFSWTIIAAIIGFYFYYVAIQSFNAFFAPDDAKIFLKQYQNYLRNDDNLIQFLLSNSLYPHPKFTSRVFTILSDVIFGNINFKFIQIIGNLGFLFIFLAVVKFGKLTPIKIIPIAFVTFVPIQNTFWTISVSSLPWLFGFVILTCYFYHERRVFLTVLFTFLSAFSSGQGFLIIPLLFVNIAYRWFIYKKLLRADYLVIISSIGILILHYFLILSTGNQLDDTSTLGLSISGLIQKIPLLFSFIGSALTYTFYGQHSSSMYRVISGIVIISIFLLVSVKALREKNSNQLALVSFGFYFLGLAFLAILTRLSMTESGNYTVPTRYDIHSIYFTITVFTLILRYFKTKWIYIVVLLLSVIYFVNRGVSNYKFYSTIDNVKLDMLQLYIAENETSVYKYKPGLRKMLMRAISGDKFEIPNRVLSLPVDSNVDYSSLEMVRDEHIELTGHYQKGGFLVVNWYYFSINKEGTEQYLEVKNNSTGKFSYCKPYQFLSITKSERLRLVKLIRKFGRPEFYSTLIPIDAIGVNKNESFSMNILSIKDATYIQRQIRGEYKPK